jgi:hypothetical protein
MGIGIDRTGPAAGGAARRRNPLQAGSAAPRRVLRAVVLTAALVLTGCATAPLVEQPENTPYYDPYFYGPPYAYGWPGWGYGYGYGFGGYYYRGPSHGGYHPHGAAPVAPRPSAPAISVPVKPSLPGMRPPATVPGVRGKGR